MSPSKFAKFACEICDQTLHRKQSYQAHMRSHRADKDFKCTACDKGFGSKAWLTRHLKTHPTSENRPSSSRVAEVLNRQPVQNWEGGGILKGGQSPFTVLPREIWCMIMENMPFTDTLNFFKAYPEMETIYKKKKQLWLFDQVFPFILGRLRKDKDILICRRVSYKWKEGVDNFLEKSLIVRPYDPNNQVTDKIWGPRNYPMCHHFHDSQDYSRSQQMLLLHQKFVCMYYFSSGSYVEQFKKIHEMMVGHPPEINPFVGRCVGLRLDSDQVEHFWEAVKDFLKIWGKHIWFLRIWQHAIHQVDTFVGNFVKCLEYLPNLKSILMDIRWVKDDRTIVNESGSRQNNIKLPYLPHLEAIKMSHGFLFDAIMFKVLLPNTFKQIRRLHFRLEEVDIRWYSTPRFRFPYLRELQIELELGRINVDELYWNECKVKLNRILFFLEATGLHSLDLGFWNFLSESPLTTSEIFQWFKYFPELKHLCLASAKLRITGPYSSFLNGSVESICLNRKTLNSTTFLNCFQLLRCLQIYIDTDMEIGPTFTDTDRLDFYKLYVHHESFWKDLLKLQKLDVIVVITGGYYSRRRQRFYKTEIKAFLNSQEGKSG